jgi:hypothetical protein
LCGPELWPVFQGVLGRLAGQGQPYLFLLELLVKVDAIMIEILAISMVSVYAVAIAGAFLVSQVASFRITRHFNFRH